MTWSVPIGKDIEASQLPPELTKVGDEVEASQRNSPVSRVGDKSLRRLELPNCVVFLPEMGHRDTAASGWMGAPILAAVLSGL